MLREKWSSSMGFILASIGSAVGIGNIWRTPKMLKKGEYSYTMSTYYSGKKIGSAAGEFRVIPQV